MTSSSFNLGILADDPCLAPFLKAIEQIPGWRVTRCWTPADSRRRADTGIALPSVSPWDDWLLDPSLDAILVAGVSPEIVAAAQQLAASGKTLWLIAAAEQGPAALFRHAAGWSDAKASWSVVSNSGLWLASFAAYRAFQESDCGRLWRVEFERRIAPAGPQALLASDDVDRWLFADLPWLRELTSPWATVAASGSGVQEDGFREGIVALQSEGGVETHWRLAVAAPAPSWTLVLRGTRSSVEVCGGDDSAATLITPAGEERLVNSPVLVADARAQLLACAGAGAPGWPRQGIDALQNWGDVGALTRRARDRRRTLEVHLDEVHERSQFKSQMAALGCGVLLWTLFAAIAALLTASLLDPRDRAMREARALRFVITASDVSMDRGLTGRGAAQLDSIARGWSSTTPDVLVEKTTDPSADQHRVGQVVSELSARGVNDAVSRVRLSPLHGVWFEWLMRGLWVLVFGPLGVVLLLQLLIVVARGGEAPRSESPAVGDRSRS